MIDKQDAISLTYRSELHHSTLKNADGTPLRCRVNGKVKLWKTRPDEFRLPVKHGLKNCFYIDQDNCHEWNLGNGLY